MKLRFATCVCLLAAYAASAYGHSDVLVRTDGTKVLVGAAEDLDAEEGGPFFDLDTRFFEGILFDPNVPQPPFGFDFEREEPGFFSEPGIGVGGDLGAFVQLELSPYTFSTGPGEGADSVFYWDGSGAVDFEPLGTAQPGVSFEAPELTPLVTNGSGEIDNHPLFGLDGGAAEGVYLTGWVLDIAGLDTSDPFYIVWLAEDALTTETLAEDAEEALEELEENGTPAIVGGVDISFYEEAVEFAEATVPEPSAAVLTLAALAGLGAVRRR